MADTFNVDLATVIYRKRTYGAGLCFVHILGATVRAVALVAGKEKHVTTDEHAANWLVDHGLPAGKAVRLVERATA